MGRTTTSSSENPYLDNVILHEICSQLCDRIDEFFDEQGIELRRSGRRFVGRCPVHGGRSPFGLNFYPDGQEVRGYWECLSDKCHLQFPRSAIGFVRGVLSHDKHGWQKKGDRAVSHRETVDLICQFLKVKINDIKVDRTVYDRQKFSNNVEFITRKVPATHGVLCTQSQLRKMTDMPANYYLERGYKAETLNEFEVGEVIDRRSREYGRVIVPVYDPAGAHIIGALSRSTSERCEVCGFCHDELPCPVVEDDRMRSLRWKVIGDFNDKLHLYNLWRASSAIKESRTVVLVEGAGDVWRAWEAGIHNVVGLFGSNISDTQTVALECMGLKKIVLGMDADQAGRNASASLQDRLGYIAKVIDVVPDGHDFGSMDAKHLRGLLKNAY